MAIHASNSQSACAPCSSLSSEGFSFIENRYDDLTELYDNQENQTNGLIQFVLDASPNYDGYAYYEYLGTTIGDASDYRRLSDEEATAIDTSSSWQVRKVFNKGSVINNLTSYPGRVSVISAHPKIAAIIFDDEFSRYLLKSMALFNQGEEITISFANITRTLHLIAKVVGYSYYETTDQLRVDFDTSGDYAIDFNEINTNDTLFLSLPRVGSTGGGSGATLNKTEIFPLNTSGINFNQPELKWVRDAVNSTAAANGGFNVSVGTQIVFSVSVYNNTGSSFSIIPISVKYYRLTSGATTVTTLGTSSNIPLMPDGSITQEIEDDSDLIIDLGDIGTDSVEDAFNSSLDQPFTMSNDNFVQATQGGEDKLWQWIGGAGTFGNSSTLALSSYFVDLTDSDVPQDTSGGSDNYNVNVLDFASESLRNKIIQSDLSQNTTDVTSAVNDAISYCHTNGIKQLEFGTGLYIIDSVTFNNLNEFHIIGNSSVIKYNIGDSIFNFTNCNSVSISGFNFTSDESSYSDVAFIRATDSNSYFKIFNNRFENFPRCGILGNTFSGGVFTEGFTMYANDFIDSENYSNNNQCGIELGSDGEYSKVINNNFYNIPSAIRFMDGANGLFAYNNCLLINGDFYDSSYNNAVIYSEYNSNSGKLDVICNKLNHNETGIISVVVKGDPSKSHNAIKIEGNDFLVNGSTTRSLSIYLLDAPNSIIVNNKLRGNSITPNDKAILLENSSKCVLDNLYIKYYNNCIELINSSDVQVGYINNESITGENIIFDTNSETFNYSRNSKLLERIVSDYIVSNEDDKKTISNYSESPLSITIPDTGIKSDFSFDVDAITEDITISEGSNSFLPSGDKTIFSGDYAKVYLIDNKYRFLYFENVGGINSPPSDGSDELALVIARADTEVFDKPNSGTQTALQTLIASFINNDIWINSDLILMFSYNDTDCDGFSTINIKSPSDTLASLVNSPVYSVNGFKGNGINSYIDTGFNPSTYGGNFTRNDASRLAVVHTATTNSLTTLNRIDGTAIGVSNIMVNGNATVHRINSSGNVSSDRDLSGTGMKCLSRADSTNINIINKNISTSAVISSVDSDNENLMIFRDRTNYGDCGVGLYIVGSDLSDYTESIRAIYNTYLNTIGLTEFA